MSEYLSPFSGLLSKRPSSTPASPILRALVDRLTAVVLYTRCFSGYLFTTLCDSDLTKENGASLSNLLPRKETKKAFKALGIGKKSNVPVAARNESLRGTTAL
jgi:hypothetical protein